MMEAPDYTPSPADWVLIASITATCAQLQRLGTAAAFEARDDEGVERLELWADEIANQAAAVRAAVATWRAQHRHGESEDDPL